jgi:putative Mg2+ transporter-C (MgtC) family protein
MQITNISIGMFEHRLLLAFILGTVIGFERQWRHKIAGVKTNALVAVGAALFILLSEKITGDASAASRIAANIVTGIGFLGAGVMMRNGINVTGINTAATIWCSAAIGSLAGLGYWYESLVGTTFVVLGNILLRPIGEKIDNRIKQITESGNSYIINISVIAGSIGLVKHNLIDALANEATLHITAIQTIGSSEITANIHSLDRRHTDIENIVNKISSLSEVTSIRWEESKSTN